MLALGDSIDGTPDDLRPSVENSAKFQVDRITVYANTDKQQVVLTEKLRGDEIDGSYIAEGAGEAVSAQTYRSVLKPNEFGTLEVTEEVNNRDSQGRLVSSWARKVAALAYKYSLQGGQTRRSRPLKVSAVKH